MQYIIQWQQSNRIKLKLGVTQVVKSILLALEKRKQRRQLLTLSDHLLNDIGITREQALKEAKSTK